MEPYGDEPGPVVAAKYATNGHFANFASDQIGSSTREDSGELVNECRGAAW